jgi:hypothetical protein
MSTVDEVLDRLVADAVFVADWDEVVQRSGIAGEPWRAGRWRSLRAALVLSVAVVLVGAALAAAGVGPFDSIRSWLTGTPGKPASPAAQRAFRAANGHSWQSFPSTLKLRKLISTTFDGQRFTLYGFRSGRSACLTLRADTLRASLRPACAPVSVVERMSAPIVVVAANRFVAAFPDRRSPQVSFGIAADQVSGVTVATPSGPQQARVGGNAYLWVDPEPTTLNPVTRLTAHTRHGSDVSITPPDFDPMHAPLAPARASGPTHIQARLRHPEVGWLRRGERLGRPPSALQREQLNRLRQRVGPSGLSGLQLFKPDPASDIVVGISGGCLYLDSGFGCTAPDQLFSRGPLQFMLTGASNANSSDAFVDVGGIAADGVTAVRAFFPSGDSEVLALENNMFAGVIPNLLPLRLVAYDARGRVVGIEEMGGFSRPAPAGARNLTRVLSVRGPRATGATLAFGPEVSGVRCWRLTTTAGPKQSSCDVLPLTGPSVNIAAVQAAGGDVFVAGWTKSPVV